MAKFDGLEPRRCEYVKGLVAFEKGPKSFGTLEKLECSCEAVAHKVYVKLNVPPPPHLRRKNEREGVRSADTLAEAHSSSNLFVSVSVSVYVYSRAGLWWQDRPAERARLLNVSCKLSC